jgi:dihydroxyacetone kinase DhaKLM complex PTS-EIIA-like component DhaM
VSISESPDLSELGLEPDHVQEALERLTQHLLARGATVAYGGDLRAGGFTQQLLRFANRYCTPTAKPGGAGLVHYFPWPSYLAVDPDELAEHHRLLSDFGSLILVARNGATAPLPARRDQIQLESQAIAEGLTSMRRRMSADCDARIVLGGRVDGYAGRLPGIVEEAVLSIAARKPLFVLGGFGGAASDVAQALGWSHDPRPLKRTERYRSILVEFERSRELAQRGTNLSREEAISLANTRDVELAISLVLRGLTKHFAGHGADGTSLP